MRTRRVVLHAKVFDVEGSAFSEGYIEVLGRLDFDETDRHLTNPRTFCWVTTLGLPEALPNSAIFEFTLGGRACAILSEVAGMSFYGFEANADIPGFRPEELLRWGSSPAGGLAGAVQVPDASCDMARPEGNGSCM